MHPSSDPFSAVLGPQSIQAKLLKHANALGLQNASLLELRSIYNSALLLFIVSSSQML